MKSNKNWEERLDDILEGEYESRYEQLEELRLLEKEVRNHSDVIKREINLLEDWLIDDNICPKCGMELEFEPNGLDTYVPYGDTKVLYAVGGDLCCSYCRWRIK